MDVSVTIIMPALNEEESILEAIDNSLSAFKEFNLNGEVLVINDGSTDSTPLKVRIKMEESPGKVRLIDHPKPLGIGKCFWDGVDEARGDFVCMIPGDNENDPREILRYSKLLGDVDIVVPFVFNKEVRPKLRDILSSIYHLIINLTFFVSLNYTNGTVLYRKSLLKELDSREKGFFFQTDILIRLIKSGYLFAEVPYRLNWRKEGRSKAINFKSFFEVIKGYLRLVRDIYFKRDRRIKRFISDSISAKRYKEL